MMMREEDIWALVLDATRARILRGLARRGPPRAAELVMKSQSPRLRAVMAGVPVPNLASAGAGRRPAGAGPDPLKEDERAFLREVIAVLETHRRAGDVHRLVIFAQPHALGLLRTLMPPALQRMVLREMPLNLVRIEAHELPRIILDHLGRPD